MDIETSGVIGRHKVVSYFAGCGGMDLGFHGGFEVLGPLYPSSILRSRRHTTLMNDASRHTSKTSLIVSSM